MNRPPQQKEPEKDGEGELNDCYSKPTLNELPQARNEKAANRRYDVSCRSLTGH